MNTTIYDPSEGDRRQLGARIDGDRVLITVNGVEVGIVELSWKSLGSSSAGLVTLVGRVIEYRTDPNRWDAPRLSGSFGSSSDSETRLVDDETIDDLFATANDGRTGCYIPEDKR